MKTSDTATLKKVITDVLYNSKFISFFFAIILCTPGTN